MVIMSGRFCLWCFDLWWCLRCLLTLVLLSSFLAFFISGDESDSSFLFFERVNGPTGCSTLTSDVKLSSISTLSLTEGNRSDTCSYDPTSKSCPNSVWLRRHSNVLGPALHSISEVGFHFFCGGESITAELWQLSEDSDDDKQDRYSWTRTSPKLNRLLSSHLEGGTLRLSGEELTRLLLALKWEDGVRIDEWPVNKNKC